MSSVISGKEYPLMTIFSSMFEFKIPPYQRPYAWSENEVSDLIEDLFSFYRSTPGEDYFLGSIVLIKEEKNPYAEVIDGQQRLTSLSILLAVIASMVDEEDRRDYLEYIIEPGKKSKGLVEKPRLTLRDIDNDFFKKYILELKFAELFDLGPDQLKTEAQKHLQQNALLFKNQIAKKIKNLKDLTDFGSFIVQHCFLVVVSSPSQKSAFRVFSVLNNRGLDLLPCDIIKADIIGKIPSLKQKKYTDLWENIENLTGRDKFNELFGHIRMIYAKKKQQSTLLEEFDAYVIGDSTPSEWVIDNIIQPYAEAYRVITKNDFQSDQDATQVNRLLYWLNKIDNNDWLPPAIRYLSSHHQFNECFVFLKKLERLAAVMHICAKNVNYRISRYAQVLEDIAQDNSLPSLELYPEETALMFKKLNGDVYTDLTGVRRNYLILRLDSFVSDGSAQYSRATLTIEHVLPQQPRADSLWLKDWSDEEERKIWTHRLANLVPLSRAKNSEAQNFDFEVKKQKYFNSSKGTAPFALTSQVLIEPVWTPSVLVSRQKRLLDVLKKSWDFDANFSDQLIVQPDFESESIERNTNKLTFSTLRIPVGSELVFFKDHSIKCFVKDQDTTVCYQGEDYALSTLALKLLHARGLKWKSARGADHFLYNGMKLSDIPR